MEGQYSEKVMEHFRNPRNVGEIPDADGIGNVGNPVCGDIMRLYIKVDENEIITDAKFKTFGCLPTDEDIVLSEGGWGKIQDVDIGKGVINSEGKETEVADTFKRDYDGRLYKITPFVSPFNSFSVTSEHPVLCIKREWIKGARRYGPKCSWLRVNVEKLLLTDPDFVKASDLSKGDYLIFNVNKEIKDDCVFTKEAMRLIGYYLSEGYISAQESVVAFAFNRKEKELIQETEELLEHITGKKPKSRIRDNVAEIYSCSRRLANFLILHCGKMAPKKALSKNILSLPFSKQWEMIQTYLSGDGDSYRRRASDSRTYRIITTSKPLTIQVQEMLARGGIFASIRKIFKTNCYIGGRKLKDSVQYLVSFKRVRNHRFVHYNGEYFLVPIKKIAAMNFKGRVYNLQVYNEPNSYLVKGFAVHNCGAAIATSSMVTELVKGKTIQEALKVSNTAVAEALGGLPKIKMHCSVLAEEALKSAIDDYLARKKKAQ